MSRASRRHQSIVGHFSRIQQARRILPTLAIIVIFASLGYGAVLVSRAATFAVPYEAENGSSTGDSYAVSSASLGTPGASNDLAIKFGTPAAPAPVPTNLKVFAGGDSIALNWRPKSYNGNFIQHYNVYRDGVKIATTNPDANDDQMLNGSMYVDRAISVGESYTYQVQTLMTTGAVSSLTPGVVAAMPTSTTPVPNVVLDTSFGANNPDRVAWMQTYGIPEIKTWYPKIADILAKGGYTAPSTMTIKSAPQATYDSKYPPSSAVTIGTDIIINPRYMTSSQSYYGDVMVHESGHVLQYYHGGDFGGPTPFWFVEGMADYGAFLVANSYPYDADALDVATTPTAYYTDRYRPSTNFLRYLNSHYDPSYVRGANIASHNGTFNTGYMHFADGRDTDQAWGLFRGTTPQTGRFVGQSSNKCLSVTGTSMQRGTLMVISTCNGEYNQRITYHPQPNSSNASLIVYGQCIEAANSGTANGTYVWINDCNANTTGQNWIKQANGSIVNPSSGRCLEINGGNVSANDNQRLGLWDCTNTPWQKWTLP